jgi:uncharacterized membrane protein
MRNIVLILLLLIAPFFGLAPFGVPESLRGRIGITCVFLFTGFGHFLRAGPMAALIPPRVPERWRLSIIYVSGVFELAGALAVLISAWSKTIGVLLCVFLVLVLPANVDSAIRRVPFGGHGAGLIYLLVRIPLQAVLVAWIYWFAIRAR